MENSTEQWRTILGFEGLYMVSSHGRIRSQHVNRKGAGWQLLTGYNDKKGYRRIGLCKEGKKTDSRIHRLVASAYLLNPDKLPEVNHKDGNKANNHRENLEWCSGLENIRHAYATGLVQGLKGTANGRAKLTAADVVNIRALAANGMHYKAIAAQVAVNAATVHKIINRKLWNNEADT